MLRFSDNLIAQMTLGCNCNCKYCYEGNDHSNKKYIDTITFQGLLDKYIFDRCVLGSIESYLNFHFHGGEVFTIPWEELKFDMDYLFQRKKYFPNLCLSIQTNGTLLTDEMAKYFADNNVSVGISWDGYISDRLTQEGNTKLIDKLRKFHEKYGTKFHFLSVLSKKNMKTWVDDIRSIQDISDGFGINTICTLEKDDDLKVSPEEQWEYWINPVLQSLLTDEPLRERAIDIIIEKLISEDILITSGLWKSKSGCFDRLCGFGSNMTAITPDLVMHNCDKFMENGPFIDKREEFTLQRTDLWGYQQVKRAISHYKKIFELENKLGCSKCPMRIECNGECQSYNISRYGEVKIDNSMCSIYLRLYDFFSEKWPEVLSHSSFGFIGDVEGISPSARKKLLDSGYELRIDTDSRKVSTIKVK